MSLKTKKARELQKANTPAEVLNNLIVEAIQDKKGLDIVTMDLRKLDEAPASYFIVCHGNSENQVKAIADSIQFEVKKKGGELPLHVEGTQNAVWVLVDYFDIVVHIFHREAREFYQLEELWSDAIVTEYQSL